MTELICIECPNGCKLRVDGDALRAGRDGNITGNKCGKGLAFAKAEVLNPERTLSSTVRTVFAAAPVLPVRTDRAFPKDKIGEVMKAVNSITVTEKLAKGAILIPRVAQTEANIIVTSDKLLKLKN
ncbi:MAG: DUF1667 domain-containing protein [Clostridiales bacterium]|jgi:CxxC motif-containing protein|nr:DUF1667 domain-containing protein [Clostridiales bacterium]